MAITNLTKDELSGVQFLLLDSDFTPSQIPELLGEAYDKPGNFCATKDFSAVYVRNASTWEKIDFTGGTGSYSAGNGIEIANKIISAKIDASTIKFGTDGKMYADMSGKQDLLSANNGIDITDNTITAKVDNNTIKFNDAGEMYAEGGGGGVFIATYDTTTFIEIYAAYNAGKIIYLKANKNYLPLVHLSGDNGAVFAATMGDDSEIYNIQAACQTDSTWSGNMTELQPKLTASSGIDITNNAVAAKVDGTTITTNASGQLTLAVSMIEDTEPF